MHLSKHTHTKWYQKLTIFASVNQYTDDRNSYTDDRNGYLNDLNEYTDDKNGYLNDPRSTIHSTQFSVGMPSMSTTGSITGIAVGTWQKHQCTENLGATGLAVLQSKTLGDH